jgi:hypothetical protein
MSTYWVCRVATGVTDSPRGKKKVNAFELLGSAMDISNLFEVFHMKRMLALVMNTAVSSPNV